jgi:hypothetical protein
MHELLPTNVTLSPLSQNGHRLDTMPSFFTTPREIRNEIYHHLFTSDPYLICDFYDGFSLTTHYSTRCCAIQSTYDHISTPTWLLTSKTLMREALEQYSVRASWVYDSSPNRGKPRSHSLPLDRTKIRKLEMSVEFVPQWSVLQTSFSEDPRHGVWIFVETCKEAGLAFERVRLQGYAPEREVQLLGLGSESPYDVARIFRDMREMFEGVEVGEWTLEVATTSRMWETELVFALVKGEVAIVGDERGKSVRMRETGIEREHTGWCEMFVEKMDARIKKLNEERIRIRT